MVLHRDIQLDRDVVLGLGIEGDVLVLGHERDVAHTVDDGDAHVEARVHDLMELAEALDDADVLLLDDVEDALVGIAHGASPALGAPEGRGHDPEDEQEDDDGDDDPREPLDEIEDVLK